MRTSPKIYVIALFLAVLLRPPVIAQQPAPSTAPSPAPVAERPLANEDVIKLSKLDLGNEVVVAKINQAKAVDFKLDTEGLVALKQEGVSKEVITAMLNRTAAPQARREPATSGPGMLPPWMSNPGDEGVLLRAAQREVRLQSVQGDLSSTYAFVTMLMFVDFPGLKAEIRITDQRPTLIVRSIKSPRGRIFLVKCKSNPKDNNRSVKVGRSGMFSQKSWSTPDMDWVAEFDTKELPDNTWEITPKRDLEAGEYGVLFKGGFNGLLGSTQAELFDFGVDGTRVTKTASP